VNISYRLAHISEIKIALDLLKLAALRLKSKNIDQWQYWLNPSDEKVEWINSGFLNNEIYFIVDEAKIIGMYRLQNQDLIYWGDMNDSSNYIHSLVVIDEYTGNKIGSTLLKYLIEKARNNNVSFFRLDCNASNIGLCNYYLSLGFQKVGEVLMPHSLNNLYEIDLKGSIYFDCRMLFNLKWNSFY
jgi:ribosomal protein S18 acetylase RimI-like enzyme